MFRKHVTVFLNFESYWSFKAKIQTHSRAAKFFLIGQIIIGLLGILLAIVAGFGKSLLPQGLEAQIDLAKHIALYNLMTLLLIPAVSDLRITGLSGEPLDIKPWFYKSSRLVIKAATPRGLIYLAFTFILIAFPPIALMLDILRDQLKIIDSLFAVIFIALGVMMYIYALKCCRQDTTHD